MRLMLIQSGLEHLLQQFLRPAGARKQEPKVIRAIIYKKIITGNFPRILLTETHVIQER